MIILKPLIKYIKLQRSSLRSSVVGTMEACQLEMEKEYDRMLPYLPEKCEALLDIGCGAALMANHLWQQYKCDLYLLDKTQMDEDIQFGFRNHASFYNSLELARDNLMANGVKENNIHLVDADDKLPDVKYDVIISLIAWGFHFPIEAYLDYVLQHLSPEGVVILDIRIDTNGMVSLADHFDLELINATTKSHRIVARRQP